MLPYKKYLIFKIKGKSIHLFSDETAYGTNTVAEIDDQKYYIGNEPANVSTAIFAYQELNNILLSIEELKEVMFDNYDQYQNNITTEKNI